MFCAIYVSPLNSDCEGLCCNYVGVGSRSPQDTKGVRGRPAAPLDGAALDVVVWMIRYDAPWDHLQNGFLPRLPILRVIL